MEISGECIRCHQQPQFELERKTYDYCLDCLHGRQRYDLLRQWKKIIASESKKMGVGNEEIL